MTKPKKKSKELTTSDIVDIGKATSEARNKTSGHSPSVKEQTKHLPIKIIAVVFGLLLVIGLVVIILTPKTVNPINTEPVITVNNTGIQDTTPETELERRIRESKIPLNQTRPTDLPNIMFEELPPFPEDFFIIDSWVQFGTIKDLRNLSENYWKSPYFYPLFENQIERLLNPDPVYRGWKGLGFYPADYVVDIVSGEDIEIVSYMRAGWAVENWQGTKLNYIWMENVTDNNGNLLKSNTTAAQEHIRVETNPVHVLLAPSYPIFQYDWTRRIAVKISTSVDTPSGIYIIGIVANAPDVEMSDKWRFEHKQNYVTSGSVSLTRPPLQILVFVG